MVFELFGEFKKKNEWAQNRALRVTGPILQSTVLQNKIIKKLKKAF